MPVSAPWDRRSRGEHERARSLLLDEWLPAATTFSSFWEGRLPQDADRPDDLEGLRRLEPVRERDVLSAGGPGAPALLLAPEEGQIKALASGGFLLAIARAVGSGGSLGKDRALRTEYKPIHLHQAGVGGQLAIAYTRSDLDRLHRCGARAARVVGLGEDSCLVSAVPAGPDLRFWGVYHLALGSSMLAVHPRGAGAGLEDVVASLALVPATAVAVLLEEAVELADLAEELNADCGELTTVLTLGPPPDDAVRAEVAAAWRRAADRDVAVRALWAPGEARALWAECAAGAHGLHTYPDLEVLEVLDPVTRDVSDTDGDLTYTSAGWHGTGLLRYQTGAYMEGLTEEPCPGCGRTVSRLVGEVAPGVWQPWVEVGDGIAPMDFRGAAAVLEPAGGIEAWRVELTAGQDGDRIEVKVAGPGAASLDGLAEDLAVAMGVRPTEIVRSDVTAINREITELGSMFADLR